MKKKIKRTMIVLIKKKLSTVHKKLLLIIECVKININSILKKYLILKFCREVYA